MKFGNGVLLISLLMLLLSCDSNKSYEELPDKICVEADSGCVEYQKIEIIDGGRVIGGTE